MTSHSCSLPKVLCNFGTGIDCEKCLYYSKQPICVTIDSIPTSHSPHDLQIHFDRSSIHVQPATPFPTAKSRNTATASASASTSTAASPTQANPLSTKLTNATAHSPNLQTLPPPPPPLPQAPKNHLRIPQRASRYEGASGSESRERRERESEG
jgi:hypothetical protein